MHAPLMGPESLRTDCRWFKGWVPCAPHKELGVHCTEPDGTVCPRYVKTAGKILVIKLGAIGDVIRTTPLLHALKHHYPLAHIWWLTLTPEILPSQVDVRLAFTPQGVAALQSVHFDLLVNLDKDREACGLATTLFASVKRGFLLENGNPAPADANAVHKFMTGLFDDLNRANTRSYPQEIFEICGYDFTGERYMLDVPEPGGPAVTLPRNKKIVGLNTGCGGRWTSRLWPEKNWIALATRLRRSGMVPLLLGGEQEHAKNLRIAKRSGAKYFGHFPLGQFIGLVDRCDLVVTSVTMALHIAIGLGKKVVLFNNIFNSREFELYGLGEILEPDFACDCYYAPTCPNNCMQYIRVDRVETACARLLAS